MAVIVDSGELPTARGKTGYDLERVIREWQIIADGRFEEDCKALLQMIDEVDELKLWRTACEGFYKTRDEFLQKVVLIDYNLTEQSLSEIVARLRRGEQIALVPLGDQGGDRKSECAKQNQVDNVKLISPTNGGNSQDYIIRRLKRDAPELAERVIAGELSANAAAIQAGFRPRTVSVPVDSPQTVLRILRKHMARANL